MVESRTLISYNVYPPAMLCYAHGMILHPGTAPNIPEDQHLDGDCGLSSSCSQWDLLGRRWFGISTGQHQEDQSQGRGGYHGQRQEEI